MSDNHESKKELLQYRTAFTCQIDNRSRFKPKVQFAENYFVSKWSIPLTNVKWHSDPWPTVTSQPIRLSINFMTLIPSLTFTDYEWFPWSICNGCGMPAGNAYPSGHLVPSPILGLANAPIVETKFLELAMSLLDFSPRIPLGTFSILLWSQQIMQSPNRTGELSSGVSVPVL